jgi:hypothetical protein
MLRQTKLEGNLTFYTKTILKLIVKINARLFSLFETPNKTCICSFSKKQAFSWKIQPQLGNQEHIPISFKKMWKPIIHYFVDIHFTKKSSSSGVSNCIHTKLCVYTLQRSLNNVGWCASTKEPKYSYK